MSVTISVVAPSQMLTTANAKLQRRSLFNSLFLLLIFWPYAILPNSVNLVMVTITAIIALTVGLCQCSSFSLGAYWPFSAFILLQGAISLVTSRDLGVYLSQINHLLQFILLVPAFAYIVRESDWRSILRSRKTFWILVAIVSVTLGWQFLSRGTNDGIDFDIGSLMLITTFLVRSRQAKLRNLYLFVVIMLLLSAFFLRIGPLIILGATVICYFYQPYQRVVRIIAISLVIMPVIIYLTASQQVLLWLKELDFNTFIRAEYIKGALPYLTTNPLIGVGFDTPFRKIDFPYLVDHGLLNDGYRVNHVSNHHSLFDTTLRLGLFAAIFLFYFVFIQPKYSRWDSVKSVYLIALGQGLGVNAWLENQHQLIQSLLLIALLNFDRSAILPRLRPNPLLRDRASSPSNSTENTKELFPVSVQ